MLTLIDERLRREARSFALRFGCDDCVHYDPDTRACGNGWPNRDLCDVDLESASTLGFCKEFELK